MRTVEADGEAELPRLERDEADAGLDVDLDDLFRRGRRHFLDVHAAGGAGHHHRLPRRAIEHEAQIQLARHLQPFFDEHARDDAPFGAGLMRDERHADHVARETLGLVGRLGQLDAAAFPASAGVDLRLHDDEVSAETTRDFAGLGGVEGDFAARHRDAVPRENGLGLILVDFHDDKQLIVIGARRGRQHDSRDTMGA